MLRVRPVGGRRTRREALAAHDEVLRAAIEAHGGWLFKHTGDGVCAAFASPKSAVDAAVAAIIPTASGDGRIIARLFFRTDDPHARQIVMDLDPMALAGIIHTSVSLEKASVRGEINRIAQQLDLATQLDLGDSTE